MALIHPTAIIDPRPNWPPREVGPYAVIGAGVRSATAHASARTA
jgi:acyl-[acyl carrier protein]--UDP-N-acetylglucosamine O-acyltransferase